MQKIKARDLDTVMSLCAVAFAVSVFLFTARAAQDIVMIAAFIAAPTKFIAVARWMDIIKGDKK